MQSHTSTAIDALLKRWGDDINNDACRGYKELRRTLTHPLQIINSPLLSDHHPVKMQAYAVLDAWDSATNGMENHGAWLELENIGTRDVLFPWKLFAQAIRAYYQGHDKEAQLFLREIPDDTSLTEAASRFLDHLANPKKELIPGLNSLPQCYQETLEQLESTAYPESEEYFREALEDGWQIFIDTDEATQEAFSRWVIRFAAERGLSLEKILPLMKQLLGRAEAEKAAALALYPMSPETALLFWARGLSDQNREPTDLEKEIIKLLEDQTKLYQQEFGEDPDFANTWRTIAPEIDALLPKVKKPQPAQNNRPNVAWNAGRHGQLELFAS